MRDLSTEEFMTVPEIAQLLKLNPQTIRNWIDADTLPALRLGRRVRVIRSDLDRLLANAAIGDPTRSEDGPSGGQAFWEGRWVAQADQPGS